MKKPDAYTVVLQVQKEGGEFEKLSVSVTASDKDNARTAAVEKAKGMGHTVTNCHSVDLNG